jgi:hypothetical protein
MESKGRNSSYHMAREWACVVEVISNFPALFHQIFFCTFVISINNEFPKVSRDSEKITY